MSIAKLAYLTSPGPDRYVLNIQLAGSDELQQIEIYRAHLANIIIDGAALALRATSKTAFPSSDKTENANGDDRRQLPA